MKNLKKIAYSVLILIIIIAIFALYKVYGKDQKNGDIKQKALTEVKQVESTFLSLFNELNNIKFENYTITTNEIKKEASSKEDNQSGGSSGGGSSSSLGGSGDSSQSKGAGNTSEKSESSDSEKTSKDNKEYNLKETGILTKSSDINWDYIKNETEKMYTSLSKLTLDLYETNVNQQEIVNFNKEYDNLIKSVKDENKADTLTELSILYNYLPTFIENCTDNEIEKSVIKTKNNVFKAYCKLDNKDWANISFDINQAIQEYTKIVTSVDNFDERNKYTINKAYVIINELQNAINLEDTDIFLIKYKNLLEELQNI